MGRNHRGAYPADWKAIARSVKDAAGWRCVRCGHRHEAPSVRIGCDEWCDLARHPEWTRSMSSTEPARYDASGCRFVRVPAERQRARVLTVAHLDDDKSNCAWWNCVAMCQVCHLVTQARVEMHRPWVVTEHSAWFRPYVAAFYARKYLGLDLTRAEVEARLDELLGLERAALGMEAL